ncbi:hypothetical protein SAMN04489712_11654 [Thermomonospora echinospora]|uniref:Uncharacterized protein n=1 Tax=Thermomonospora echinospora TaxID=1992 RepID=A0A1H6DGI3_9ACTN|nr:hypothetical protein SAMN04489712_11654 [Thermomonospora echinospora]
MSIAGDDGKKSRHDFERACGDQRLAEFVAARTARAKIAG